MRHIRLILIAGLLALIPAAPAGAQEAGVAVIDNEFDPARLEVSSGTEVTWTNHGDNPHTVTADDGSFSSGNLDPGESFTFSFNDGDEFPYYCEYHGGEGGLGMSGTIVLASDSNGDNGNGDGNGGNGDGEGDGGDDGGTDANDDELPTTGPTDIWAYAYLGIVFVLAGIACLRVSRWDFRP